MERPAISAQSQPNNPISLNKPLQHFSPRFILGDLWLHLQIALAEWDEGPKLVKLTTARSAQATEKHMIFDGDQRQERRIGR